MKSLSSSRREVLVDCFHVHACHISHLLPDSAVLQHSAAAISSSGEAQVFFYVSVNDAENSGSYFYSFEYSGQGNPLEEAGEKLKAYLSL